MPSASLLSIAYREFVNTERCQEIKFKQYIRSWTCLFRALFIFVGRMISNRLAEGGMDYYHVGFSQQRGGYSMLRFICSIIRLAGCWFISHTHHQNASLFNTVSYIQPYKHPSSTTVWQQCTKLWHWTNIPQIPLKYQIYCFYWDSTVKKCCNICKIIIIIIRRRRNSNLT